MTLLKPEQTFQIITEFEGWQGEKAILPGAPAKLEIQMDKKVLRVGPHVQFPVVGISGVFQKGDKLTLERTQLNQLNWSWQRGPVLLHFRGMPHEPLMLDNENQISFTTLSDSEETKSWIEVAAGGFKSRLYPGHPFETGKHQVHLIRQPMPGTPAIPAELYVVLKDPEFLKLALDHSRVPGS